MPYPIYYGVREHPEKKKPLVTPIFSKQQLEKMKKQGIKFSLKRNISSGEDCANFYN